MTDLARRVLLSKAGLTSLIDRLEDRGLVARVDDPDDRRAKRIVLTPTGGRVFREAARIHDETVDRWFRRHLGGRAATVAGALDEVLAALGRAGDDD